MEHRLDRLKWFSGLLNYSVIIYKLIFPDGKCYVGMSKMTFDEKMEWYRSKRYTFDDARLVVKALRKFDWEDIKREELASCKDFDEACCLEDLYIKSLNTLTPNGLNMKKGGVGVFIEHTEESKRKISEKNKGRKWTDEQRKKYDENFLKHCSAKKSETVKDLEENFWPLVSIVCQFLQWKQPIVAKTFVNRKLIYTGKRDHIHEFYNERSKQTFIGTRTDFKKQHGLPVAYITRLVNHDKTLHGWMHVKKVSDSQPQYEYKKTIQYLSV